MAIRDYVLDTPPPADSIVKTFAAATGPSGFAPGYAGDYSRTGVWINIHADPHNGGISSTTPIDPAEVIDNLLDMLLQASFQEHRLTVLLSPPWVEYLLSDYTDRLRIADAMGRGHVLGFHHHDVTHNSGDGWDGYQSVGIEACIEAGHTAADCGGSTAGFDGILRDVSVEAAYAQFEDLMEVLFTQHFVDRTPYELGFSASHGTDDDYRDLEWQDGAVYSQRRAASLIDSTNCNSLNGVAVTELGSIHLAVGNQLAPAAGEPEPSDIVSALGTAGPGEYVGTTIHAWEYRSARFDDSGESFTVVPVNDDEKIRDLFQSLRAEFESTNDPRYMAVPMHEILDQEGPLLGCVGAGLNYP